MLLVWYIRTWYQVNEIESNNEYMLVFSIVFILQINMLAVFKIDNPFIFAPAHSSHAPPSPWHLTLAAPMPQRFSAERPRPSPHVRRTSRALRGLPLPPPAPARRHPRREHEL
jgi:hypothetical protein